MALAHDDLQDVAKHNVSIMHQRNGDGLAEVRKHAVDCVQTSPIVQKLSGSWARHPIIGPMYGPAYLRGRETVNEAIETFGNLAVARVGYHLKGRVDIKTFEAKVNS